jgi:hypothetical protein
MFRGYEISVARKFVPSDEGRKLFWIAVLRNQKSSFVTPRHGVPMTREEKQDAVVRGDVAVCKSHKGLEDVCLGGVAIP